MRSQLLLLLLLILTRHSFFTSSSSTTNNYKLESQWSFAKVTSLQLLLPDLWFQLLLVEITTTTTTKITVSPYIKVIDHLKKLPFGSSGCWTSNFSCHSSNNNICKSRHCNSNLNNNNDNNNYNNYHNNNTLAITTTTTTTTITTAISKNLLDHLQKLPVCSSGCRTSSCSCCQWGCC